MKLYFFYYTKSKKDRGHISLTFKSVDQERQGESAWMKGNSVGGYVWFPRDKLDGRIVTHTMQMMKCKSEITASVVVKENARQKRNHF